MLASLFNDHAQKTENNSITITLLLTDTPIFSLYVLLMGHCALTEGACSQCKSAYLDAVWSCSDGNTVQVMSLGHTSSFLGFGTHQVINFCLCRGAAAAALLQNFCILVIRIWKTGSSCSTGN